MMKTKKHKLFFLALISLVTLNLFSQSSGYMGKKFVGGYGFYFSPGYIGSKGATPVNMLHEGYLEYATSKNFMVGFSARMYNAVYTNGRQVDFKYKDPYYYSYNTYTEIPDGSINIKARNYMLYGKVFTRNYVAPWGRYFTFGLTLNTFKSTYDSTDMKISIYSYSYYNNSVLNFSYFGPTEQSFKKLDVMIGFGRSRIIANRVIIDYGYNVNLLALGLTLFDAPDDNVFGDSNLTPAEYVEKTTSARIRGVNRFNIFCKVGILLF